MRRALVWLGAAVLLASCGYHLAGHGRGAVPEDVRAVAITGADVRLANELKRQARSNARDWAVTDDAGAADAELRLGDVREQFVPVGYDANGVAVNYRLTLTGSLSLWRNGKQLWRSGPIAVSDEVYAVGGPASIDASRARVRRDLTRQWLREAWQRLTSGF